MQKLRAFFLVVGLLFSSLASFAQEATKAVSDSSQTTKTVVNAVSQPDMADALYANGKIYVVVVVLAIIFAAIILFLVVLERKISKLEKENKLA